jgi:hypothetical protein
MNDKPLALDPFAFMARLREADILHRVGSLRDDSVLVEVRTPGHIWEIEFFPDSPIECERFASDGRILQGPDLAALIAKWSDTPPDGPVQPLPQGEFALMRRLREAGNNFQVDELRMRRMLIDGAIMIEASVPGEHWEIDILPDGEIEMERFETEFVHDFDAAELHELLAGSAARLHKRRRALRL